MQPVTWSEDYSIENMRLDDHHKLFFELFKRLNDTISDINSTEDFNNILAELGKYAATHFTYEEIHMLDISYDQIKEHAAQHAIFKAKIKEFNRLKNVVSRETKLDLLGFLKKWMQGHIVEEDKKLAEWKESVRKNSAT